MRITATGTKNGETISAVCDGDGEDFSYTFNGKENPALEAELVYEANAGRAIGGTYFPETWPLKLVTALDGWFFDRPPEIEVDGDLEEIPSEDGVIY